MSKVIHSIKLVST